MIFFMKQNTGKRDTGLAGYLASSAKIDRKLWFPAVFAPLLPQLLLQFIRNFYTNTETIVPTYFF